MGEERETKPGEQNMTVKGKHQINNIKIVTNPDKINEFQVQFSHLSCCKCVRWWQKLHPVCAHDCHHYI